jgi:hypothetical protein
MRIDFVFSYWIFGWYILYILGYAQYNPKFAIGLGLIENIGMLILMLYFNARYLTILYFIIINLVIKGIPFYTLLHTSIHYKDVVASFILFLLYVIWMYIHNKDAIEYQYKIANSLIKDKHETPSMWLLNKIENYFKNYKTTMQRDVRE